MAFIVTQVEPPFAQSGAEILMNPGIRIPERILGYVEDFLLNHICNRLGQIKPKIDFLGLSRYDKIEPEPFNFSMDAFNVPAYGFDDNSIFTIF